MPGRLPRSSPHELPLMYWSWNSSLQAAGLTTGAGALPLGGVTVPPSAGGSTGSASGPVPPSPSLPQVVQSGGVLSPSCRPQPTVASMRIAQNADRVVVVFIGFSPSLRGCWWTDCADAGDGGRRDHSRRPPLHYGHSPRRVRRPPNAGAGEP